ncbi:hypothetical protein [Paenarthrobacter ureafaciens]|uniref:hypothetical protein n=1 Tax=Paenarthrobacter ureafaciens TaxID=37931 RepID=UPI001FB3373E|nr:hypothetical protein [Paenarthrobacter ureafaciens]UOD80369.1 hypothetical protein MQZ73_14770 [Paenarthrobacter ureafaciens]WNZ03022.1 hypothetical protein PVT25_15410 [Paenarthrobacter ureafaciens]
MKIPRPLDEHLDLLTEQVGFLRRSASAFDDGEASEAKRLATTLRVLLHDTPKSASLLSQMQVKASMQFLDSAGELHPENLATEWPLVMYRMTTTETGMTAEYWPHLGGGPPVRRASPEQQVSALLRGKKIPRAPGFHLSFDDWWEQQVVDDKQGGIFTRKQLVMALANQDGGAHVDPQIEERYHALSRLNSLALQSGFIQEGMEDPSEIPEADLITPRSPVPACVRQIAWEFLESLPAELR